MAADGYRRRAGLVADDRDVVVGTTFVGTDLVELLQSATVAATAGLPLQQLRHAHLRVLAAPAGGGRPAALP